MRFRCISAAIPVDLIILHWYACSVDGLLDSRSVGRSVYSHVISKFSRMGSLYTPFSYLWCSAARASRERVIPSPWNNGAGGGLGLMDPLPLVSILPLVESLWPSLQDEVYFMRGGTAGGLWRHQTWSPSCIFSRTAKSCKNSANQ